MFLTYIVECTLFNSIYVTAAVPPGRRTDASARVTDGYCVPEMCGIKPAIASLWRISTEMCDLCVSDIVECPLFNSIYVTAAAPPSD